MEERDKRAMAAIFDLDGTLYTGHMMRAFSEHHRAHKVKRRYLYLYLFAHIPIWWLLKAGVLTELQMRSIWSRDMGWLVRGWRVSEAASAFDWIASLYVRPLVRQDILERLRKHQSSGYRIILVSGTPAPLLQRIGRELGIEETVGTPLVRRNGRYTGRSEKPTCQGPGKVARLTKYLGDRCEVDWQKSYAFADSYLDLPLLELVGNPVAVYPDEVLKRIARERSWEIIEEGIQGEGRA